METKFISVLLLVISLLCFCASPVFANGGCHGFKLPHKAEAVGANRYLLNISWEQAQRFYRRAYAGNPRVRKTTAVALPGVNAIHFENLRAKVGTWEGANLSRIKGKVFLFCYVKEAKKK